MSSNSVDKVNRVASPSQQAWQRFKQNRPALFGLCIIAIAVVVAVLGYAIAPDKTPYSNNQQPELHILKPGTSVRFLQVTKNQIYEESNFFKTMLFGRPDPYTAYSVHSYSFAGATIAVEELTGNTPNNGEILRFQLADVAFALDPLYPPVFDSVHQTVHYKELGKTTDSFKSVTELRDLVLSKHLPTNTFVLGTDLLGRDLLSRLLIGTRISLSVGLISVIISILIGVTLGAAAGYFRGTTDAVIMWLINVVWSIPTLLLVIAITLVLGRGITQVFIAVGLTMWVEAARIVRGQVLSLREKEFVEAGRALGFSNRRIILRHILPNIAGPVIVIAASNFASAILTEAGLSFLGIGAQPPIPSWGEMTNAHHGYILMDKAWLAFIPGCAIMLLVLSFMLVGNGLRDALDTRSTDSKPIVNA